MTGLFERRLRSEWELLQELSRCNPGRISGLCSDGTAFHLALHGPEAYFVESGRPGCLVPIHAIRIDFPVHFPAVPMELFLQTPVFHPNIHPENGFVCLWDRHRVSNTVEHAMHKLAAMLCGALRNTTPVHVLQPAAWERALLRTTAMPLLGVLHGGACEIAPVRSRRQRLQ